MSKKPTPRFKLSNKKQAIRMLVVMVTALLFTSICLSPNTQKSTEVSLTQFEKEVILADNIEKVEMRQKSDRVIAYFPKDLPWTQEEDGKTNAFTVVEANYPDGYEGDLTKAIQNANVKLEVNAEKKGFLSYLLGLLPYVLIFGVFIFILLRLQGGASGAMKFGKSMAKDMSKEENVKVSFSDVAGIDEVLEEVIEIKEFLKDPKKFRQMGAKLPKGVLLVGPPGCGKTLLARAVAGEAGVPFYSLSGSDFVEMFVGVGASRVRDLFEKAKQDAPSIIFIDEIDAVGRHRGAGLGGGHDEREQTLNQLLVEMDGFKDNSGVMLIAATNRPDILDPALLRPGRFDRQIVVDKPDKDGRYAILKVHSNGKALAPNVSLKNIAQQTPGFTGADLANLINEAALLAARRDKEEIEQLEIEDAIDRVITGSPPSKNKIMSEEEKKTVAYHEAGHALVGHVLPNADPVIKISIVKHGRMGGYTRSVPEEDVAYYRRKMLLDRLAVMYGGRVAEEMIFGEDDYSTGASNDIQDATQLVEQMITTLGMSERLGPLKYGHSAGNPFLGRDVMQDKNYSDKTAQQIDAEKLEFVSMVKGEATLIIQEHRDALDRMANALMEREAVSGPEIDEIFGEDIKNSWERQNW